jgi:GxxExxY protein
MNKPVDEAKYPCSELTEKVIGFVFEIFNVLGYGLQERIYQKSLAECLLDNKIKFSREKYGKIIFKGKLVGKYYADFVVDDQVVVELKVRNEIYESHKIQLLNYLKSTGHRVGLLIVFTKSGVKIKRIINNLS